MRTFYITEGQAERLGEVAYGCAYSGSKSRYVPEIIQIIKIMSPGATEFYDLFGGGAAMVHYLCANGLGDYRNIHYNDISNVVTRLFDDSFSFNDVKPLSRSDYYDELGRGNDSVRLFQGRVQGAPVERSYDVDPRHFERNKARAERVYNDIKPYHDSKRISFSNRRCDDKNCPLNLPDDAIKYCDPPYFGTLNSYGVDFDREAFLDWANKQDNLYISEHETFSDPRFVKVWQSDRVKKSGHSECLFIPRKNMYFN